MVLLLVLTNYYCRSTRISQHVYSGSGLGCGTIDSCIQDLMGKQNVRGNLSAFVPDIAATKAQGLTYVLGETNSYFDHASRPFLGFLQCISPNKPFDIDTSHLTRAQRMCPIQLVYLNLSDSELTQANTNLSKIC